MIKLRDGIRDLKDLMEVITEDREIEIEKPEKIVFRDELEGIEITKKDLMRNLIDTLQNPDQNRQHYDGVGIFKECDLSFPTRTGDTAPTPQEFDSKKVIKTRDSDGELTPVLEVRTDFKNQRKMAFLIMEDGEVKIGEKKVEEFNLEDLIRRVERQKTLRR